MKTALITGSPAELVRDVGGCRSLIPFDSTRRDGTSRELPGVSRLRALARAPKVHLRDGIEETWRWCAGRLAAGFPSEGA